MVDYRFEFDEYQQLARRTQNRDLINAERMMHALHGMCSEVGEIHGLFQKQYQGHELDRAELKAELGDLMWFVCEMCDSLGESLSSVCFNNIEKLRKRYPEGFDAERSLHRE